MEKRDKLIQDTAVKAGSILLSSGAEIYRVEETVKRIAAYYGLKNEHTFVLSNGIFLTAETLKGEIYAQVRHIPINSMNLKKITKVNTLSREIEQGYYTVEEAWEKLQNIDEEEENTGKKEIFASGVGAACFCYLFGGNASDTLAALLAGVFLYFFIWMCGKRKQPFSKIVTHILGGFCVTAVSVLLAGTGVGSDVNTVIIVGIMPLLPGVSFVMSVRELFSGNYIAGSIRLLDTFLITGGIAMGAGAAYFVCC